MKTPIKLTLICLFVVISGLTKAQQNKGGIEIFDVVENPPLFNGAQTEPMSREYWQIAVKEEAEKMKLKNPEGKKTFIQMVIYLDGSIGDVKIIRSSGNKKFDKFAMHCGKTLNKWAPGMQRGKAVNSRVTLPVYIK